MHLHQHYRRTCRKKLVFGLLGWALLLLRRRTHSFRQQNQYTLTTPSMTMMTVGASLLTFWDAGERERGIERPTARVDNLHKKSPVAQKQHKYTFTHAAAPRLLYSLFSFFLSVFKRYVCISVSSSLQQHQKKEGRRSMMHRRQKQTIKDLHTNERTTKER